MRSNACRPSSTSPGAGRQHSCSTTSSNTTTAAYRRSALGVKPPCGSSLGSYFLVIKREKPPPDNQHSGFPPLADVLDSERPIDRLPTEIRHVRPPPLTNGHSLSTADLRSTNAADTITKPIWLGGWTSHPRPIV